jgi:catechol 2,3-dioxygenase-like lactoylglutathione lyase family enzyme
MFNWRCRAGRETEARAFYEGVLGIPEVQKPPNLVKRGGCDEPLAGYDRVYVDDPFGNRIELLEPTAASSRDTAK